MGSKGRVTRPSRGARVLTTLLAACLLATPALANNDFEAGFADENATSHPAVDILLLRPLGLVALAGGVSLFVPAGAITLLTRPTQLDEPYEWLVARPARYVWVDPIGIH